MRINSDETYRAFQIEITHGWRKKHNLPPLSDNEALARHYGDKAIPATRRRMNTSEHMQRLLKVWDTWKQK